MSNSPASPGPDLFFAGGECLDRFGVWVRRTDMDLEAATRETATRSTDGSAVGRDGIIRTWEPDTARAHSLNEIDLDPTRNILVSTDLLTWDLVDGADRSGGPTLFRITDDEVTLNSAILKSESFVDGKSRTITHSLYVQRVRGAPTALVRLQFDGAHGVVLNTETGAFSVEGTPDATSVALVGEYWFVTVTKTATSNAFNIQFFPALNFSGDISGAANVLATGSNRVKQPQVELGSVATDFQETPRDLDRKFSSLLLELATANDWSRSEELDNANYVKSRVTVDPNVGIAPDGATTADKIIEDNTANNSHFWNRVTPSLTDDSLNVVSFYVKAAGRNECQASLTLKDGGSASAWFDVADGIVGTLTGVGTIGRIDERLPDGWFRVSITFDALSGGTAPSFSLSLGSGDEDRVYDGDGVSGVFMWGIQFTKNKRGQTSYFPTGTAIATREQDLFFTGYPHPPQEETMYAKFIEDGTVFTNDARALYFGKSDNSGARFYFGSAAPTSFVYFLRHNNGVVNLSSQLSAGTAIADLVELRGVLHADGSCQIFQSRNGAAETSGPRSGTAELAATWGDQFAFINGLVGVLGAGRYIALKANRGVRDLDFMRAL